VDGRRETGACDEAGASGRGVQQRGEGCKCLGKQGRQAGRQAGEQRQRGSKTREAGGGQGRHSTRSGQQAQRQAQAHEATASRGIIREGGRGGSWKLGAGRRAMRPSIMVAALAAVAELPMLDPLGRAYRPSTIDAGCPSLAGHGSCHSAPSYNSSTLYALHALHAHSTRLPT
jgi:hypothetical protein